MRTVFSNLVAASLLMHAVMGCCWHHAHAASCGGESLAEQALEDGCHHHHGDDCCDDDHGQPSPKPCEGHPHCHGVCNFLPVQKTQLDTVQLDVPFEFAAIVPAACDAHRSASFSSEVAHDAAAGPPVRLHLYHQILLI